MNWDWDKLQEKRQRQNWDNSLGITAETIYIDGGFNALACCVDQAASENA